MEVSQFHSPILFQKSRPVASAIENESQVQPTIDYVKQNATFSSIASEAVAWRAEVENQPVRFYLSIACMVTRARAQALRFFLPSPRLRVEGSGHS